MPPKTKNSEQTFWHLLLEADGAPGAVGRALVTVRNLGGGTLPRPAWGRSLPGGYLVRAPPGFTPSGPGKGERAWQHQTPDRERASTGAGGSDEGPDEERGGGGPGNHPSGGREEGGGLPDNPLLEEFFPRGGRLHEALFYRVSGGGGRDGRGEEKTLPFNERVGGP